MDHQICRIIRTSSNTAQLARFSSPSSVWNKGQGNRDLSLPGIEKKIYDTHTEKEPTTEGDLHFLEQLLQHRDLRHLSQVQKTRRGELIAAIADFKRIVSYTATYFKATHTSDVQKPFALIGSLVIRTASDRQQAEILSSGFENRSQGTALRAWADEFGLTDQELSMLCHPESISEPGQGQPGMSPAFDGLRKASRERRLEDTSHWMSDSQKDFEGGAPHATSALLSRPENSGFKLDLTHSIPVGEDLEAPRLRAFIMPSYEGEPIIALTFSRSF